MLPSLINLSQSFQLGNPLKYPPEIAPFPDNPDKADNPPNPESDPNEVESEPAKFESLLRTSAPEITPNPLVYEVSP
jgi:hypothetical protein